MLILSLLNSSVLEFFNKVTSGNTLYSKRFPYWSTYLKSYPIPDFRQTQSMIFVKQLIANTHQLLQTVDKKEQEVLEQNNEQLIYWWFGLVDDEVKEMENILRLYKA